MLSNIELVKLLQEINILYIEDDKETNEEITETLKMFSQNIFSTYCVEEAIQVYKKNPIQLIITDIELPKENGISFIEKIRDTNIFIPIIVISAYKTNDYLFSCANLNIQSYIIKPINANKLKESLYKIVKYLNLISNILVYIDKKLSYDKASGQLIHNGLAYKLSKKEKLLMDLLVDHKNKLVTYGQIEQTVWYDFNETMSSTALRTIIKNLRKKGTNNFIENISGLGYKLNTINNES
ncbi:MAG: response regulator transcription factor [Arcobacteraceae bacterium]|nr:response regulator transcription factor [Arcobacteraceae bacterium]